MKSLVLAAVAALCVVALPVSAATTEKASTTTTTTMTTPMSAEDCTAALAKCTDDACKADLAAKGCVAPEAK